jgi:hypothetical protein
MVGFAGLGLPTTWEHALALLCAGALASLGYHATDCVTCPGNALRKAALIASCALVLCAIGCAVSSLGFKVSAPAFGTLQLTVGGGSIGKGQSNAPPAVAVAAMSEHGTNAATK